MEPYQRLGESAGYEIGKRGTVIILARRGTRPAAIATWIVGGMAAMALAHAALWPSLALTGSVALKGGLTAGAILFPAAVFLALIARSTFRRYRTLRDLPIDDVPGFRADLAAGVLLADDEPVAELADISIDTTRNLGDSTQGSMRWIWLRWQGGKARIYSASARESDELAERLRTLGVGKPATK